MHRHAYMRLGFASVIFLFVSVLPTGLHYDVRQKKQILWLQWFRTPWRLKFDWFKFLVSSYVVVFLRCLMCVCSNLIVHVSLDADRAIELTFISYSSVVDWVARFSLLWLLPSLLIPEVVEIMIHQVAFFRLLSLSPIIMADLLALYFKELILHRKAGIEVCMGVLDRRILRRFLILHADCFALRNMFRWLLIPVLTGINLRQIFGVIRVLIGRLMTLISHI